MSDQVKKDIIVVAREGYSVLLEIEGKILDVDCHQPMNLSNMFAPEIIDRCTSLSAHLKDGNLVLFEEGTTELSEDTTASAEITPLREETAEHITSQYEQSERDADRTNMELETRANITDNTRKQIQEQVQAGKKKVLQADKKIMAKAVQTSNKVDDTRAKERQNAMTSDELTMKVSMDISPEEFAKRQAASKEKLETNEEADEMRAEREIAKQDAQDAQDAQDK